MESQLSKYFGMYYVTDELVTITPKTDCALAWLVFKNTNKIVAKDLEKFLTEFLDWCATTDVDTKMSLIRTYADRVRK